MTVERDIQQLEPGALIELYELDMTALSGEILRFHAMQSGLVIWQGLEYSAWPITAEGFARTTDQQPQPKLMVGNVDGSISLLCITFEDMVGAKLTRKRTFGKYLDAVNFPEGNPSADPTQAFPDEVWFIERKTAETAEAVEFELASALDFAGVQLPRRQIIQNSCPFQYRGAGCNYVGPAVSDVNDNPTTDPALDRCGKRLSSCKLRQWPDDVLNFGGMPSAGLMRT